MMFTPTVSQLKWVFVFATVVVSGINVTTASPKARVKYDISWDPAVTEQLTQGRIYDVDVNINEYMDIICPQYDVDAPAAQVLKFVIYNVSKQTFTDCSRKDGIRKVLACDTPSRSKKLTLKFQQYSPNPLGFVYHPGKSYYFMAYGDDPSEGDDPCASLMRMKINVRPNRVHHHPRPTKRPDQPAEKTSLQGSSSPPVTPPTTTLPPKTTTSKTRSTTTPFAKKTLPTQAAGVHDAVRGDQRGGENSGGQRAGLSLLCWLLLATSVAYACLNDR